MNFSDFLAYENGALYWKTKRHGRGCVVGNVAGTINRTGRRVIEICGTKYLASRIVWAMHNTIEIPRGMCIDHIDGNKLNDNIENLRMVTLSTNQRNSKIPKNNKTGIMGVYQNKYGFVVSCAGKHIGSFKNFFDACCARKSAETMMSFHENHGRKAA